MDQHVKRERLKRKICDVVSVHQQIVEKDQEIEIKMKNPSLMMDIKLEMESKSVTKYLSCVEIVLFSKLSTTIWDDSVIIPWENLERFFGFFGHNFDTYEYLKRGNFSKKEAFLFYYHISDCIMLDPVHGAYLVFDLDVLTQTKYHHDFVYINLDKHLYSQNANNVYFYYPQVLSKSKFDPVDFDEATFPFMQDLQSISRHVDKAWCE